MWFLWILATKRQVAEAIQIQHTPRARIAEQMRRVVTGQYATPRTWAVTRRTGSEHSPRDRRETDAWEH